MTSERAEHIVDGHRRPCAQSTGVHGIIAARRCPWLAWLADRPSSEGFAMILLGEGAKEGKPWGWLALRVARRRLRRYKAQQEGGAIRHRSNMPAAGRRYHSGAGDDPDDGCLNPDETTSCWEHIESEHQRHRARSCGRRADLAAFHVETTHLAELAELRCSSLPRKARNPASLCKAQLTVRTSAGSPPPLAGPAAPDMSLDSHQGQLTLNLQ